MPPPGTATASSGPAVPGALPDVASSDGTPDSQGNLPSTTVAAGSQITTDNIPICPDGYLMQVIRGGGRICRLGPNVLGPFPEGMRKLCRSYGGGNACQSGRWSYKMVKSTWGAGSCPRGTWKLARTSLCRDSKYVYGPFSSAQIAQCRLNSDRVFDGIADGNRCTNEMRWNLDGAGFLVGGGNSTEFPFFLQVN